MKSILKVTLGFITIGLFCPSQTLAQISDEACSTLLSEVCEGAAANVCFEDADKWKRVAADCVGYTQTMIEMSREANEQVAMEGASWGGSVRSGPGIEFGKVGSLKEGALVELEENTGVQMNGYPWFKITQYNSAGGVTLSGYQWGGILCAFDAREGVHETCPAEWSGNPERQTMGQDNIAPVHGNSDEDNEMIAIERISECLNAAQVDGSVCIGQVFEPCLEESNDYSTLGMRSCISLEHGAWDSLLNADYRRLMDSLDSDTKKTKLRDAQRHWIKYAAAFCSLGYEFNQGTAFLVSGDQCHLELTARQTLELRKLIPPTN